VEEKGWKRVWGELIDRLAEVITGDWNDVFGELVVLSHYDVVGTSRCLDSLRFEIV
jgi:hypothetical protein